MSRVRIKFCGITRVADALHAAALGVDALGFVFWPQSPRYIEPALANRIIRALPSFVTTVGLFVDQPAAEIAAVMAEAQADTIQLHGSETPAACAALGRTYIKAIRMRADTDLRTACADYAQASALLLDTHVSGLAGGTGQVFDWALIPARLPKPLILAGGLRADNVGAAIARVQPWAVDVSGGIESAKGIKDMARMDLFVREVRLREQSIQE